MMDGIIQRQKFIHRSFIKYICVCNKMWVIHSWVDLMYHRLFVELLQKCYRPILALSYRAIVGQKSWTGDIYQQKLDRDHVTVRV